MWTITHKTILSKLLSIISKISHSLEIVLPSFLKNIKEMPFLIAISESWTTAKMGRLLLIWMLTIGWLEIKFFNLSTVFIRLANYLKAKENNYGVLTLPTWDILINVALTPVCLVILINKYWINSYIDHKENGELLN